MVDRFGFPHLEVTVVDLKKIATMFKKAEHVKIKDHKELLDALCDNIQTAASVAHCAKLDLLGGMNEVMQSNFSKFTDGEPIFDENRKIKKGTDYFRPNLEPFVK